MHVGYSIKTMTNNQRIHLVVITAVVGSLLSRTEGTATAISDPGTADEVCRSQVGPQSSMARQAYQHGYGDALCANLACVTGYPGQFEWRLIAAPDGMKCGTSKLCINGRCVFTSLGDNSVSETCPYGDQPDGGVWRKTCAAQIERHGCSTSLLSITCCSSCYRRNDDGGEFNNADLTWDGVDPGTADDLCSRLEGRASALVRSVYDTQYGDELCYRLACAQQFPVSHWSINPYRTPNGMKCGRNKRCMGGRCLPSPTGDPAMSDACPFGDQPFLMVRGRQTTCTEHVYVYGCSGFHTKALCCASCPDKHQET